MAQTSAEPRRPKRQEGILNAAAGIGFALVAVVAAPRIKRSLERRLKRRSFQIVDTVDKLHEVTQDGHLAKEVGDAIQRVLVPNAHIGHMPPGICSFTNLTALNLSGNDLTFVCYSISQLTNLTVLNLSHNALAVVPAEVYELTQLQDLDLAHNSLTKLHPSVCNLTSLKYFNVMKNKLTALPDNFGNLQSLHRLGLKSNQLAELPASFTQLASLVELFITDNQLLRFPEGMANMRSLVKLQASFNRLEEISADLAQLPKLEMCRVAVSDVARLPSDMLATGAFPSLAWASLGGCPAVPHPPQPPQDLPLVRLAQLALGPKLGDGASGEVFQCDMAGQQVAVKVFRGDVSPDGRTLEETLITCQLDHPNLTHVEAVIVADQPASSTTIISSPAGTTDSPLKKPAADNDATATIFELSADATAAAPAAAAPPSPSPMTGLVLGLVKGKPLAAKPTSQHLLRCKWAPETKFTVRSMLNVGRSLASALAHLHAKGICHGDVYAHNVVYDAASGQVTLCDFGASFCYDRAADRFWEAMEVRAYGLLLSDILARTQPAAAAAAAVAAEAQVVAAVEELVGSCVCCAPAARPAFAEVLALLERQQACLQ